MSLLKEFGWGDKEGIMESFNPWRQMAGNFLILFNLSIYVYLLHSLWYRFLTYYIYLLVIMIFTNQIL